MGEQMYDYVLGVLIKILSNNWAHCHCHNATKFFLSNSAVVDIGLKKFQFTLHKYCIS